jgi:hypothetical protein
MNLIYQALLNCTDMNQTNTCNSRQSMDAWTKHINGATALMQLRGKQTLRTPLGYQMFVHLRAQVVSWLEFLLRLLSNAS